MSGATSSFAFCNLGLILDTLRFRYTCFKAIGASLTQLSIQQLVVIHIAAELPSEAHRCLKGACSEQPGCSLHVLKSRDKMPVGVVDRLTGPVTGSCSPAPTVIARGLALPHDCPTQCPRALT